MRAVNRNIAPWLFLARVLFLAALNCTAALPWAAQSEITIEALRAAVRADPNDAEAHHKLGKAVASRGESEEAIAHYRQALKIKPDFALARVGETPAL